MSHGIKSSSSITSNPCRVLQCVAECCRVLQCVAVRCSVLQCVAVCCSVLQSLHPALHQNLVVCCGVMQCFRITANPCRVLGSLPRAAMS